MKSTLRDFLNQQTDRSCFVVVHENGESYAGSLEDLAQLTETGREDFAALLDAAVETVRPSDDGPDLEVVISGVVPQELERFSNAYDAFMEAEQAMGPLM